MANQATDSKPAPVRDDSKPADAPAGAPAFNPDLPYNLSEEMGDKKDWGDRFCK